MQYRANCLHFKGYIPCKPHKDHGVECENCSFFTERRGRILIIKLGATGDVIRTTVVLSSIRDRYPDTEIWWLTLTPEIVPKSVHQRLGYSLDSIMRIQATEFEVVYNLDKDPHACALMSTIKSKEKFGFTLIDGLPAPVNKLAEHKFITGIFDSANKANTKSYPEEIVELCGFEYSKQEYEMDAPGTSPMPLPGTGTVIGLNTGCGDRWVSRELPIESWIELIALLQNAGHRVLLLGGPAEHERNLYLQTQTQALYGGTFALTDFTAVMNSCDVVVTAVTMAMHIAIALKKPLVLINNIFNPREFELYGRGVIVEPPLECRCFFGQSCTNAEYRCMDHLLPQTLFDAVTAQL